MDPIANETWKSFMRSYYRPRLLLLLSSLGEAYVGQLARMLRIPHSRVVALLEGDPKLGYSRDLALVTLELAQRRPTIGRGRAYEITTKGRRKARSMASGSARRGASHSVARGQGPRVRQTVSVRWSVGVTHDRSHDSWSYDG